MNIARIAALALVAGLALFLITLLLKIVLIASATFLLVRVVGWRLANRAFGPLGRGRWQTSNIISIDNPSYRTSMSRPSFERIIPIN